ncbi:hypothetical protein T45_08952 [Streptomyces turgidiscabies]|nr:hypothetical protein T45_08952 [Streptomyces turgidiscabies]
MPVQQGYLTAYWRKGAYRFPALLKYHACDHDVSGVRRKVLVGACQVWQQVFQRPRPPESVDPLVAAGSTQPGSLPTRTSVLNRAPVQRGRHKGLLHEISGLGCFPSSQCGRKTHQLAFFTVEEFRYLVGCFLRNPPSLHASPLRPRRPCLGRPPGHASPARPGPPPESPRCQEGPFAPAPTAWSAAATQPVPLQQRSGWRRGPSPTTHCRLQRLSPPGRSRRPNLPKEPSHPCNRMTKPESCLPAAATSRPAPPRHLPSPLRRGGMGVRGPSQAPRPT